MAGFNCPTGGSVKKLGGRGRGEVPCEKRSYGMLYAVRETSLVELGKMWTGRVASKRKKMHPKPNQRGELSVTVQKEREGRHRRKKAFNAPGVEKKELPPQLKKKEGRFRVEYLGGKPSYLGFKEDLDSKRGKGEEFEKKSDEKERKGGNGGRT